MQREEGNMINSISNTIRFQVESNSGYARMNDDQKEAIEQILYNYDPKNMTQQKRLDMYEEIRGIGIRPNIELRKMLVSSGYELPEANTFELSNKFPRSPIKEVNEIPTIAMEFAEKLNTGKATNDDVNKMIELLKQFNRGSVGNFVDGSI